MTSTEKRNQLVADAALAAARKAGASYADIRISRCREQMVRTRETSVLGVVESDRVGFGVRVLAGSAWGFASSVTISDAEAVRCAQQAVEAALANAKLQSEPVALAPEPSYVDEWRTPILIDPFSVSIKEKADLLLAINAEAMRTPGVKYCGSLFDATSEDKFFVSSEGSNIHQTIYRVLPMFEATAVADDDSNFQSRGTLAQPMGCGWEYIREFDLLGDAHKAGEDAVRKLKSPTLSPGKRDLVLLPSVLWLVIHESIGHATELDRALGFEANFAGTSFVTPDKLGSLRYGSNVINVVGDRNDNRGLATVGYDDDGVKATRFDIIKDGVFVGYQTVRDQAHWVGDTASHGCAYADSYESIPLQRMPNVSLQPGAIPCSTADLIAGIEDGVLIEGDGSWSIDHQRNNFQFGGQIFHAIKNGKIDGMLRDVAFQSNTVDFWNSCDAICSAEHYELGGSYWCGKAEPGQVAAVSHGSAPARFRGVNFISTRE